MCTFQHKRLWMFFHLFTCIRKIHTWKFNLIAIRFDLWPFLFNTKGPSHEREFVHTSELNVTFIVNCLKHRYESSNSTSLFPLEEEPFPFRLPASDTRKFEVEESETDDNTPFMLKKYHQIQRKSFLLNKQYQQKEHKKFAIGLKHQISAENHF